MLPFTTEQFFAVLIAYNTAVWPAPVVAYALGVVAVVEALLGGQVADRLVAGVLALLWLWTGVAYHWLASPPSIARPGRSARSLSPRRRCLSGLVSCASPCSFAAGRI